MRIILIEIMTLHTYIKILPTTVRGIKILIPSEVKQARGLFTDLFIKENNLNTL